MPALTPAQKRAFAGTNQIGLGKSLLSNYLQAAGFTGEHLREAMGIAWAESSLDAYAKSKNPDGGTNVGLFQIDQKAHPQWTIRQLEDPLVNAQAAYKLSSGGANWSIWETWVNGSWRSKAGQDGIVRNAINAASIVGDATDAINVFSNINPLQAITDFIKVLSSPSELAGLGAKATAYFARMIGEAIWKYTISPPWHWTERAVDYYYKDIMSNESKGFYLSNAGIITLLFWGIGYGTLWASVDDTGISAATKPRDSLLGRTVQNAQLQASRRKLKKPSAVQEETAAKPDPVFSEADIQFVKSLAASRRRAVTVTQNGGDSNVSSGARGKRRNGAGTEVESEQPSEPERVAEEAVREVEAIDT